MRRTYTQHLINEWIIAGGVLTRPQLKAHYDAICHGSPDYTSLNLTRILRKRGELVGHTLARTGHTVQVWKLVDGQLGYIGKMKKGFRA